jgi:hypothetical protein
MRLAPRHVLAVAAVAGMVLVGCGGDSDSDAEVVGEAGSSTTEQATTTAEGGSTDSTAPETSGGGEGTGGVDEEAPDVEWGTNASQYRGQDGLRVAFDCPPNETGATHTVWGTDTYTDDTSVCMAAVHAGLITPEEGGRVVIEIAPGEESYTGSEANGVTSLDYGAWDGSYTFPAS